MSSAKKKIKRIKTLNISELESKSIKEVWISNETDQPKGLIALEVKNTADGSPTVVNIPSTWVPICLTDQVPKKMLLDSPKFRAIISGGYIKLLDPASVKKALEDPEVNAEVLSAKEKTKTVNAPPLEDPLKEEVAIIVQDILGREKSGTITESEAKDILNLQEDNLTDGDLEHIIKNSRMSKIKKWASDALADRA